MSDEVGLVLTNVSVNQERYCIMEFGVDPDCEFHEHLLGRRTVEVTVQAQGNPEKLAEMVGRRFVVNVQ